MRIERDYKLIVETDIQVKSQEQKKPQQEQKEPNWDKPSWDGRGQYIDIEV